MSGKFTVVVALVLGMLAGNLAMAHPHRDRDRAEECMDGVRDLDREIDRNRRDYTFHSIQEARESLARARANSRKPLECWEHLTEARRELREGKWDKHKDGNGFANSCLEEVRELDEHIQDNRRDYTGESIVKAREHMADARKNARQGDRRDCREDVWKAREELRKGKWDKRRD